MKFKTDAIINKILFTSNHLIKCIYYDFLPLKMSFSILYVCFVTHQNDQYTMSYHCHIEISYTKAGLKVYLVFDVLIIKKKPNNMSY
jgi:hypothetical protein